MWTTRRDRNGGEWKLSSYYVGIPFVPRRVLLLAQFFAVILNDNIIRSSLCCLARAGPVPTNSLPSKVTLNRIVHSNALYIVQLNSLDPRRSYDFANMWPFPGHLWTNRRIKHIYQNIWTAITASRHFIVTRRSTVISPFSFRTTCVVCTPIFRKH